VGSVHGGLGRLGSGRAVRITGISAGLVDATAMHARAEQILTGIAARRDADAQKSLSLALVAKFKISKLSHQKKSYIHRV